MDSVGGGPKWREDSALRLYDPVTVMFFFRNKHMMIDLGTGAF